MKGVVTGNLLYACHILISVICILDVMVSTYFITTESEGQAAQIRKCCLVLAGSYVPPSQHAVNKKFYYILNHCRDFTLLHLKCFWDVSGHVHKLSMPLNKGIAVVLNTPWYVICHCISANIRFQ